MNIPIIKNGLIPVWHITQWYIIDIIDTIDISLWLSQVSDLQSPWCSWCPPGMSGMFSLDLPIAFLDLFVELSISWMGLPHLGPCPVPNKAMANHRLVHGNSCHFMIRFTRITRIAASPAQKKVNVDFSFLATNFAISFFEQSPCDETKCFKHQGHPYSPRIQDSQP